MSRGRSTYLPTLDGWRALAISLVVFCHLSVGIGLGQFREVGLLGVQIFFGLSGFLITTLLVTEEVRTGSISLSKFYTRRAFRIIPAALVYLIAIGILALLGVVSVTFTRWISTVLLMANNSKAAVSWYVAHFWSLAVEEHFYFIWPAVLILVRSNRRRLQVALTTVLGVALWRGLDFKYEWTWSDPAWFWGRTDIQADNIAMGVVFALAFADEKIGPTLRRFLDRPSTAPAAVGVFMLTAVLAPYLNWKYNFLLLTVRAVAVPVMILGTMIYSAGIFGRTLELPFIRFIGLVSYSLYLWQQLFLAWEPDARLAFVQTFPGNLTAAVFCAVLSFYLIERPMIRAGRRFIRAGPAHQTTISRARTDRVPLASPE
jgi:peptidoglycan/LPS O-acetylase OafA/YrhL